ncbi:MAG TPA: hypothetical protein VMG10_06785 [Gemmataceae bacterium]|nr:hypothetical protein [Gemmataceae bacterium]
MNRIRAGVLFAVAALALLPYLGVPAADPPPNQDAPKKAEQADKKKPDANADAPAEKKATAPAKAAKGAAPAKPKPATPPLVKEKPNEAVEKQFELQFGRQFQHLYRTELHLLRVVCKLTKPQYQKVAADGEPALKATKEKYLGYWRNQRQGRWDSSGQADPRETLSAELEKALQKTLTPEQAAAYKKERNLRTAAQRRAVVKTLIVMMDRTLVLSTEQRDKIHEILDKNWKDSWYTHVVRYGGNYFPEMPPDAKILPILNDTQKTIWKGVQKVNIRYGFYGLNMGDVGEFEETWDDDVPAKPEPTPEKKAVKKSKQPSNKAEKK